MLSLEIKKVFECLEPSIGAEQASHLYMRFLLSEGQDRQRILEKVQTLAATRLGAMYKPVKLLPPPEPNMLTGAYHLCDVEYPAGVKYGELGLNENELMRHVMIAGMTGAGKTTLSVQLAKQFYLHRKPIWIFDWKDSWRNLLPKQGIKDFIVFEVGAKDSLKFDLFDPPPGVSLDRWLDVIILVMEVSFFLSDGSEFILNEGLQEFEKGQKLTIELWDHYIRKKYRRGRMSLWQAPVQRAMAKMMTRRCLGNTLNSNNPTIRLNDLIGKNVIFSYKNIVHNNDKIFATCIILNYLNEALRAQPERNKLKMGIFLEDAHHIYNKHTEGRMSQQNIMDLLMDEIREFGCSMVVITLQPSKVSSSCKANTYTKLSFNLGSGDDIFDIAKCMYLDSEQTKAIDLCDTYQFIARLKGRIFEPLYCTIRPLW